MSDDKGAAPPRKRRRKPPMPDALKERGRANGPLARAHAARFPAPTIDVVSTSKGWVFESPFRSADEDEWWRLLGEVFGTRMQTVIAVFVNQVAALVSTEYDEATGARLPCGAELQAALAIVAAMKPRNEAEAAQAAQAFALHLMAMKVGENALRYSHVDPRQANALANLVKSYSGVMDSMRAQRGSRSSKQTIIVKKQVTVNNDNRRVTLPGGGLPETIHAMQPDELRAREGLVATPHATAPEPQCLSKAKRCSARRKTGEPCKAPAMRGRNTCRMHSGGKRTGAKGEANGNYRHGNETKEAIAARKNAATLLRAVQVEDAPEGSGGTDWAFMAELLAMMGVKETRAMRRARNRAAWGARDRRAWGGEDRGGWPKRPGRNGYRRVR